MLINPSCVGVSMRALRQPKFVYHSSSFSLVHAKALYDSRFLERKEYHFSDLLSLNGLGRPSVYIFSDLLLGPISYVSMVQYFSSSTDSTGDGPRLLPSSTFPSAWSQRVLLRIPVVIWCSKSGKILAPVGSKTVYSSCAAQKSQITTLIAISASRRIIPPIHTFGTTIHI